MEEQELDAQGPQTHPIQTHGIESAEKPEAENREAKVRESETRELEKHESAESESETQDGALESRRHEVETQADTTCDTTIRGTENCEPETHDEAIHEVQARDGGTRAMARASEASIRQRSRAAQEDGTQLVAIRELMMRSFAEGVWLSLSEISGATEFGEASISAQLRHLRKADHGRYRVEKRRRRPAWATAERKSKGIRDARRVPIVWEYRVQPPG